MKNPKPNQVDSSLAYLMTCDFKKSTSEVAMDIAFPKRHLNKTLIALKKEMLASVEIPGSIAENKLERIKGNVMLAYAKELNRPVRFAKPGECQYTIELEKERSKNPKQENTDNNLLNAKEASKELGITTKNIQHHRRSGKLKCTKIGGRFFFNREDVERLKIQRAIDKL